MDTDKRLSIENNLLPLNFIKKRIQFTDHFKVEKGKLSTLHAKPTQPKVIHYQRNNAEYRSQVEFESKGYSIHLPIDKIWLTMKSISVTKSTGEEIVLNDTEYRFDLLALRGTAVLLVGNDMVPAGTYSHFTITLKDGSSVELENEGQPQRLRPRTHHSCCVHHEYVTGTRPSCTNCIKRLCQYCSQRSRLDIPRKSEYS